MRVLIAILALAALLGCGDKGNDSQGTPFEGTYTGSFILGCPTCAQAFADPLPRALTISFAKSRYSYSLTVAEAPPQTGTGKFIVKKDSVTFIHDEQESLTIELAGVSGSFRYALVDGTLTLHRDLDHEFFESMVLTRSN